jgi:hypothetical protein
MLDRKNFPTKFSKKRMQDDMKQFSRAIHQYELGYAVCEIVLGILMII